MSSKKEEEKKKRDKEVSDTIKTCRQKHTDACHYIAIEKSKGYMSNKYDIDDNIERIFKISNEQDEKVKHLEERIDALSEIINPVIIPRRGGGRRTRGKLRARSRPKSRKKRRRKRRKSRRKSRRKKKRRKKRTKRRR